MDLFFSGEIVLPLSELIVGWIGKKDNRKLKITKYIWYNHKITKFWSKKKWRKYRDAVWKGNSSGKGIFIERAFQHTELLFGSGEQLQSAASFSWFLRAVADLWRKQPVPDQRKQLRCGGRQPAADSTIGLSQTDDGYRETYPLRKYVRRADSFPIHIFWRHFAKNMIYHRVPWHVAVKMRYKKLTNRTILYNITKEETKKSRILLTFSDERSIF